MNEANVKALGVWIDEYLDHEAERHEWVAVKQLAEYLAARGCLVPAALTDDQIEDLPYPCESESEQQTADGIAGVRSTLERIARGEPS